LDLSLNEEEEEVEKTERWAYHIRIWEVPDSNLGLDASFLVWNVSLSSFPPGKI